MQQSLDQKVKKDGYVNLQCPAVGVPFQKPVPFYLLTTIPSSVNINLRMFGKSTYYSVYPPVFK